jgi:trimethylamine--corrinoid protein Co-methyltransferase
MVHIKPIRPRVHLEVLNADELASIQSATLHVLENTGVRFPSQRALGIFADHGARVDMDNQIVRLPPDLVTKVIANAPRTYELVGRANGT